MDPSRQPKQARRRGRDLFARIKPLLDLAGTCCGALPRPVCLWLLGRFRYARGMAGIGIRFILWRRLAAACGDNVSVHESVWLRWPQFLELGRNVSIHPLCYLDAQGRITIGNDVSIAHNVSILSFEHDISNLDNPIKDAPCLPRPVVIEDDVWIGAGARILGGVRIGSGSVIGAGAVVTRDVPAHSLAVGVPARVIRSRRPVAPVAPGQPGAAESPDTGARTA